MAKQKSQDLTFEEAIKPAHSGSKYSHKDLLVLKVYVEDFKLYVNSNMRVAAINDEAALGIRGRECDNISSKLENLASHIAEAKKNTRDKEKKSALDDLNKTVDATLKEINEARSAIQTLTQLTLDIQAFRKATEQSDGWDLFNQINEKAKRFKDSCKDLDLTTYLDTILSHAINSACKARPEKYLAKASRDTQIALCYANPAVYLKHATQSVQEKLCGDHKEKYLPHVNPDMALSSKLLNDLLHPLNLKIIEDCRANPKENLSSASDEIQITLCKETPEKYANFASPTARVALAGSEPKQYMRFLSSDEAEPLCLRWPNIYLKHAKEAVQVELAKQEPEKILSSASDEVQKTLCRENPEKYLAKASRDTQMALCYANPAVYLKHATQSVQEKLCSDYKEKYLPHVNPAMTLSSKLLNDSLHPLNSQPIENPIETSQRSMKEALTELRKESDPKESNPDDSNQLGM